MGTTAWWQADWMWVGTGWVLCALGVAVLGWALFWDRARGRRRCPGCWYDMSAAVAVEREGRSVWICPECGRRFDRERQLSRTRRRWVCAGLALLLMGPAHLCWRNAEIRRHGWWAAVPDFALVRIAPMGPEAWPTQQPVGRWRYKVASHGALVELFRRAKSESLLRSHGQVFFERVFAADPEVLNEAIRTRDRWPGGVPIAVSQIGLSLNDMLPQWERLVIRTRLRETADGWRQTVIAKRWTSEGNYSRVLGTPPVGATSCTIESELWDGEPGTAIGRRLWVGVVRRVQLGVEAREIMTPVDSSELTADSIAWARTALIDRGDGAPVLGLFPVGHHLGSDAVDWALGARVEVLHDNHVVARAEMVYPMFPPGGSAMLTLGPTFPLRWDEPTFNPIGESAPAGWFLRVVGDPNIALQDIERTAYWPGEVTVPIKEIVTEENAVMWRNSFR